MAKKKISPQSAKKTAKTSVKKLAKKSSPHAAKKPAPGKKSRVTAATSDGPITLAEAQALVRAQAPLRTAQALAAPGNRSATHATVAVERAALHKQVVAENNRRIAEYKATMSLLKSRGVRGLMSAPAGTPAGTVAAAAAAGTPLQVFAEGDSWFDYPYPFFGGGIIPRLQQRLGVPILNLAKAGDEVRNMLGVEERKILADQLRAGSPAGGDWDVLMFSGGGNDIVGNPMALWIQDFNSSVPPINLISKARFDSALALVRAGYEDLIKLRDTLSPTTHLIFHGYDFAIPDGRGVCGMGPWLKPTFDLRRFPDRPSAAAVVMAMLQQFAAMLTAVSAGRTDVTFINTQGTLAPVTGSWHNELHPSKSGFNQIAGIFHANLKTLFPGRVL